MSDEIRLEAQTRTEFGKGSARRARREGQVPAVLYGHHTEPRHLLLNALEFAAVLRAHGTNSLLTLDIEGEEQLAPVLRGDEVAEDPVDEVEPEATAELPVEVRVLLETLLDPALAEGRDLPGAEALRSQLPHARTVTSVAEAIREAGEVPDWVPLVVQTDDDVRRAVPNDCVWPVRGRFASGSAGGHELELRLQVIDGEIGALTVTLPADAEADSDAWDAFQEIESFPGVEDLAFHVDGDRRA